MMNSAQFSKRLVYFVTTHPKAILSISILVTAFMAIQIPRLQLNPALVSLVPKNHAIIQAMDKADEMFGGSGMVVVAVESDSLLYTLDKFRSLEDSLNAFDDIQKTKSIYSSSLMKSDLDGIAFEPLLLKYPKNKRDVDSLILRFKNSGWVIGNLVSEDFKMVAFICQLKDSFTEDEHQLQKNLERLIEQYSGPEKIYFTGLPMVNVAISNQMRHDLSRLMPFSAALMLLFLLFCFRSWMGVILPVFVVIISNIWTFGLMSLLGIELTLPGVIIPIMLIAIANNYGIHIIAHYYEYVRLEPEAPKMEMVKKTVRKLNVPIILSSFTTMIGFLSLLGHVLPKVQEMGILTAFGIFVAFVMSLLIIPAMLALTPRPTFLIEKNRFYRTNRMLIKSSQFFTKYNYATVVIILTVSVFSIWGIRDIVVDMNPFHNFKAQAKVRLDNEAISKGFGGSSQILLLVEGDITNPETLENIMQIEDRLARNKLISQTASIGNIIKSMNRALHSDDPDYEVIPDDQDLISQYLFLYSLSGDETDLYPFIDDIENPQNAQIIGRLRNVQTMQIADFVDSMTEYTESIKSQEIAVEITGAATMVGVLSRLIVRGQIVSLIISLIIIFLISVYFFRSFIAGILSITPLTIAMTIVFGFMGFTHIPLTVTTALLTGIMVGVGIDYTLHFLWHLQDHIRSGQGLNEAITTTLRISGKGIVYNAISVILGFSVLLLSGFLPVNFFGALVVLSIAICFVGALTFLPALISIIRPKFLFR